MVAMTEGEKKRLKSLAAGLRKAVREGRLVDQCRIERQIKSLQQAIEATS